MDAKHYQTLYAIAKTLHQQHLNTTEILQSLLQLTANALDITQGCLITFRDDQTIEQVLLIGAENAPDSQQRELWQQVVKRGIIGHVYYNRHLTTIRNLRTDPRWQGEPVVSFFPKEGSVLAMPLADNTLTYGVLMLIHAQVDYFVGEKVALAEEVAEFAADALHNAYLLRDANKADTRYQALFDHTLVPMILTELNTIVADANLQACEFVGFSRRGLQGVPLQDINIAPINLEQVNQMKDGDENYFRSTLYDIDGREIPTLVRVRRLSLQGKPMLEWMLQDISAQMELEQLRRDLTAMVYHDLRGPLGNILTGTRYLNDNLAETAPSLRRILQLTFRSAQQLERMVESLLDIQRFEEREHILNKRPTKVEPLIKDAVELIQSIADDARQTIRVRIPENLPPAHIDTDLILRVVVNLVENAIKYTPEAGVIGVQAHTDDGNLHITISDSGPGIPIGQQQRIFDKFGRVKYKDVPKGVGLGLAFCRLAIEAHDGRIWVESDGRNGSDFKFTLPLRTLSDKRKQTIEAKQVKSTA